LELVQDRSGDRSLGGNAKRRQCQFGR
jgi:hypothetical protein